MERHALRQHLAACLILGALALAGLAAQQALAARSSAAVHMWVFTRGAPGPAMARVLHATDVRLIDAWARGHVLLLEAPSPAAARVPRADAWLVLRLPPGAAALAGCG